MGTEDDYPISNQEIKESMNRLKYHNKQLMAENIHLHSLLNEQENNTIWLKREIWQLKNEMRESLLTRLMRRWNII